MKRALMTSPSSLLLSIVAGLAAAGCRAEEATMCLNVSDDTETCPAEDEVPVEDLYSQSDCDLEARTVLGPGSLSEAFGYGLDSGSEDLICCYPVEAVDPTPRSECAVGRPYLESESAAPVLAPLRQGDAGWCAVPEGPSGGAVQDEVAGLWLRMAQLEHASVAAFARLTLELMACGAPADLLAAVQQAALDEVGHAEGCFAVAARLSGVVASPGPLPFGEPIAPRGDLVALAASAVREGCLGETLGAALAAEQAAQATDPEIRALLTRIAEDEARHAALSWRIVAWAMAAGGAPVRAAVAAAFQVPMAVAATPDLPPEAAAMGILPPDTHAAICRQTWLRVVRPAQQILLAA